MSKSSTHPTPSTPRIISSDLVHHIDESVMMRGWLHKVRRMGGMAFIVVRDRGGLCQMVVDKKEEIDKLEGLYNGTVIQVSGTVAAEPRAPGGVEIHTPSLTIITAVHDVPPIEVDKPVSHRPDTLETLFENKVVVVRNPVEGSIFRMRSELNRYIRDFLYQHEFIEIQTPKILAGATEGGAEVFKVQYFDREAVLAQSPQFYKQIMAGAFERVFEIGPTFRAEPSMTSRHMSEITMLDIEMGYIDSHEDVLNMTQDLLYTVLTRIYKEHAGSLNLLKAPKLVLKPNFPRYTVEQIHTMYSQATGTSTIGEKDMRPDEERWICDYAREHDGCEAVFVTEFPIEAMKFYHMINPANPKTVLWADLLFRGLEIATCPMREHRYDILIEQMKAAGLDTDHPGYKYYLQAFKYGMPPHGGFGFGIDRLVMKTLGLANVKEASLFPRDMNRLSP